jgi:hypothetical protein
MPVVARRERRALAEISGETVISGRWTPEEREELK